MDVQGNSTFFTKVIDTAEKAIGRDVYLNVVNKKFLIIVEKNN
jgi:hypothetical protein